MLRTFLFSIFIGICFRLSAQTDANALLFLEKNKIAAAANGSPAKCLAVARSFMGTPYVAGCLDRSASEQLVINLKELDCWTFVEYCVATALTPEPDYEQYKMRVQELRYWGGQVNGYGSRIHYFSGWILQAMKAGYLTDVTPELKGEPLYKKIHYISSNPKKYPKIQDEKQRKNILAAEKRINAHKWYFIPKKKIRQVENQIQDGDIILFTSSKQSLDIAHEGFAQRGADGRIHIIHASSVKGKVILSERPLAEYCARVKTQSGIMVIRPK